MSFDTVVFSVRPFNHDFEKFLLKAYATIAENHRASKAIFDEDRSIRKPPRKIRRMGDR